jgi:hypothetical protein
LVIEWVDGARVRRYQMKKIVIADIERAYRD